MSSIFALGGAGTLALTLACQDLAKKALNGLALSASDAFRVGDSILLGDGEEMIRMWTCSKFSSLLILALFLLSKEHLGLLPIWDG